MSARKNTSQIVEQAFKEYGTTLSLEELSEEQVKILLAVEDPNFYDHNGVDMKTAGAGLTTITQGMVKYLYFKSFQPGIAKIKQSLIARFAFNEKISKEKQLLLFINSVYMGTIDDKPVQGFHNAAQIYFDKPFSDLSKDEYIKIVAMIIGPNEYNPVKNKNKLNERVLKIKKLLKGECQPNGNRDVYYMEC